MAHATLAGNLRQFIGSDRTRGAVFRPIERDGGANTPSRLAGG